LKLSILLKTISVKRISRIKNHRSTIPSSCDGQRAVAGNSTSAVLKASVPDTDIGSIHYRAQDVKKGGLFVAIQGFSADGHDFIGEALARGASAVVIQRPIRPDVQPPAIDGQLSVEDLPAIEVEDTRRALAGISGNFFGNPSERLRLVGITGTNGKTTTACLIENVLLKAGFRTGTIGTHNYRYSGKVFNNPITTPEASDLQGILSEMLKDGISHAVMEVSSHGIDLHRVDRCRFDVGVFTNLSQDHLDFHGDMNSYWSCKKRLFTDHLCSGPKKGHSTAVINCMDKKGKELFLSLANRGVKPRLISIGHSDDHTIWPENIRYDLTGMTGRISTSSGAFEFNSPLVGKHNLENILCAVGIGIALNISLDAIKSGIEMVSYVPGRLESIPNDLNRYVYVDYAHTPDALERVLIALRSLTSGRIICVFGCGGGRDQDKRPKMGEIAARFCDLTIVTSDNPRRENPDKIIGQICDGINKAGIREYRSAELTEGFKNKGYNINPDRKSAIQIGIAASRQGDTILIAGKGNETYQVIGERVIDFDDRQEARTALST